MCKVDRDDCSAFFENSEDGRGFFSGGQGPGPGVDGQRDPEDNHIQIARLV